MYRADTALLSVIDDMLLDEKMELVVSFAFETWICRDRKWIVEKVSFADVPPKVDARSIAESKMVKTCENESSILKG